MRVLVVNAGSSSLKLQLLDGEQPVAERTLERWAGPGTEAIGEFLSGAGHVDAVGHRVVHGGERFTTATVIDDEVVAFLESLTELAPLHQPKAVAGIRALAELLPDVPSVACFDTAFHTTIPAAAATYAVPPEWTRRWHLRRYGFHGLSHAYASGHAARMLGRDVRDLRLVTCHLGAGSSLCAVRGGCSVDTTMGFTPLEGLVMVTRSGTVDPGMLLWLIRTAGLSPDELSDGLERHSGLAGLSGTSGDMRDVVAAVNTGDGQARLALDVFTHRLASLTAQMIASAGGLDALVFTGGIGERQAYVRSRLADRLAYLGVGLDAGANEAAAGDAVITGAGSSAGVLVVTAREDLQIAREVAMLLV